MTYTVLHIALIDCIWGRGVVCERTTQYLKDMHVIRLTKVMTQFYLVKKNLSNSLELLDGDENLLML